MTNQFEEEKVEAGVDKPRPFEGIRSMESGDRLMARTVKRRRVSIPRSIIPDLSRRSSDNRMGGDLGGLGVMIASSFISAVIIFGLIVLL